MKKNENEDAMKMSQNSGHFGMKRFARNNKIHIPFNALLKFLQQFKSFSMNVSSFMFQVI